MTKVIEVQNLSLTYHSKVGETLALDNISFEVKSGEFVSIVGPSGCGKTTILSILAGLLTPSSGTVLVNGEIPKTKNSQCGYMFQRLRKGSVFFCRRISSLKTPSLFWNFP